MRRAAATARLPSDTPATRALGVPPGVRCRYCLLAHHGSHGPFWFLLVLVPGGLGQRAGVCTPRTPDARRNPGCPALGRCRAAGTPLGEQAPPEHAPAACL